VSKLSDLLLTPWTLAATPAPWIRDRNGGFALEKIFSGPDRAECRNAFVAAVNEAADRDDDKSAAQKAIELALNIAAEYGTIDGGHHKMWVIDQMVRALTGCPSLRIECGSCSYDELGKSKVYREFVRKFEDGADGPETYSWDEGIAP
jgi:hypothetical protein